MQLITDLNTLIDKYTLVIKENNIKINEPHPNDLDNKLNTLENIKSELKDIAKKNINDDISTVISETLTPILDNYKNKLMSKKTSDLDHSPKTKKINKKNVKNYIYTLDNLINIGNKYLNTIDIDYAEYNEPIESNGKSKTNETIPPIKETQINTPTNTLETSITNLENQKLNKLYPESDCYNNANSETIEEAYSCLYNAIASYKEKILEQYHFLKMNNIIKYDEYIERYLIAYDIFYKRMQEQTKKLSENKTQTKEPNYSEKIIKEMFKLKTEVNDWYNNCDHFVNILYQDYNYKPNTKLKKSDENSDQNLSLDHQKSDEQKLLENEQKLLEDELSQGLIDIKNYKKQLDEQLGLNLSLDKKTLYDKTHHGYTLQTALNKIKDYINKYFKIKNPLKEKARSEDLKDLESIMQELAPVFIRETESWLKEYKSPEKYKSPSKIEKAISLLEEQIKELDENFDKYYEKNQEYI